MNIPTATYRIQFRNGMTFDRAAALVPYLKSLGISHLYASPIFTATAGSTHGYDVTDANEVDPAIGGRDGFDRLARAVKAQGLGIILDIVPNHMAASLANPWWRDVITFGEQSRYARHFDIDWSRRLTLPFLGETFEEALEAGKVSVGTDPDSGKPALAYCDAFYPLNPATYVGREREVLTLSDKADIARLHDQQPYRLMSWRDAPRALSYRRFFEITGLAGVRVEDPAVFDDTHRLILRLVRDGIVDGLRIDHVDGLADPRAYLERLRAEAGPDCYIIVEKILGKGEEVPDDWPVAGTTGYEFISSVSNALVAGDKLDELRSAYRSATGQPVPDTRQELRRAKLQMVDNNFAGEFAALVKLAMQVADAGDGRFAVTEASVEPALRELLAAFPVYRTYGTRNGLPPGDRTRLEHIINELRRAPNAPEPQAVSFIQAVLAGDVERSAADAASEFRTRFQQLTGPLMAKSVEDTLFYRDNLVLALNEVGADPLTEKFSLDRFHEDMRNRLKHPGALSATSTHDTKRGEDARARLYTMTEAPGIWAEAVGRWRKMNETCVRTLADGPAPEPALEWMIYQALAGVWPAELRAKDKEGLQALESRFVPFVEKAVREAKLRTNWADPDETYEAAVIGYARRLLLPGNNAFIEDFVDTLQPFIRAGLVNSLAGTIIKLAAPGVPDIYQGCEGLDFSLVDPDNRREPDFSTLQQHLTRNQHPARPTDRDWLSGSLKQRVIGTFLRLRQEAEPLFRTGAYLPLEVTGTGAETVIAFARAEKENALVVAAPRLAFDAMRGRSFSEFSLTEAEIALPRQLSNRAYRDVWTGEPVEVADVLKGDLLQGQPCLALWAD